MPNSKVRKKNPKNGSIYISMNHLVDMFYTSRFNRDNMHDLAEGEDIDNSTKHRIYNKGDVKELMSLFGEFFEWAINAKDLGRIYLSKDTMLVRETVLPRVKYATVMDEYHLPGECKAGEYYITPGRYTWKLWVTGEPFKEMKNLWLRDPEILKRKEELIPEMEEKNAKKKSDN